jgi:hypothetical protein
MDPVGFSVGIIGLAGLVSTCIEAFQIIRSMKAYERDTELLFTKLDIEKDLFIQWAQRCGLLKRQHVDGRLFNPKTDAVVARTVHEINILLGEAMNKQRKYAIDDRWESARPGYEYSADGAKIGRRKKFLWTIHDKEDFEKIINELGYLIEKLERLIPSLEQRKAMRDDLDAIGCDPSTLHLLEYKPRRQKRRRRYSSSHDDYANDNITTSDSDSDDASAITLAADLADRLREQDGRGRTSLRPSHSSQRDRRYEDRFLAPPPPSYTESQRSHSSVRSCCGSSMHAASRSRSSRRSVHSSSSHSSRSRKSNGDAAREMFGDLTGRNRRPSSGFR